MTPASRPSTRNAGTGRPAACTTSRACTSMLIGELRSVAGSKTETTSFWPGSSPRAASVRGRFSDSAGGSAQLAALAPLARGVADREIEALAVEGALDRRRARCRGRARTRSAAARSSGPRTHGSSCARPSSRPRASSRAARPPGSRSRRRWVSSGRPRSRSCRRGSRCRATGPSPSSSRGRPRARAAPARSAGSRSTPIWTTQARTTSAESGAREAGGQRGEEPHPIDRTARGLIRRSIIDSRPRGAFAGRDRARAPEPAGQRRRRVPRDEEHGAAHAVARGREARARGAASRALAYGAWDVLDGARHASTPARGRRAEPRRRRHDRARRGGRLEPQAARRGGRGARGERDAEPGLRPRGHRPHGGGAGSLPPAGSHSDGRGAAVAEPRPGRAAAGVRAAARRASAGSGAAADPADGAAGERGRDRAGARASCARRSSRSAIWTP